MAALLLDWISVRKSRARRRRGSDDETDSTALPHSGA